MKLGIMQPYFFPYLGYFQLLNLVDQFVIYDNIEFSKRGWIHRNKYQIDCREKYFTIPLKKDSDYLNIAERYISDDFDTQKKKILMKFIAAYRKAPYYEESIQLVQECLYYNERNLFKFIYFSIQKICEFLNIKTKLVVSSNVSANHDLKGQERIISICKACNASQYINPIGGIDLYSKEYFAKNGIRLNFLKMQNVRYKQYNELFLQNLSILDVLMFNSVEKTQILLNSFELL
jgi:hypothetical protein